ncbi:M12 family metallo-peptidase [Verrucomicrobiales bacterium]|nr:M12 family metallo-peptidase [Verrucomicrobiales bacterium]
MAGGTVMLSVRKQEESQEHARAHKAPSASQSREVPDVAEDADPWGSQFSKPIGVDLSEPAPIEQSIAYWRGRPEVVRSETVDLPDIMKESFGGAKLLLPLPGGESVEVTRWFESRHAPGQFSISGEIAGGDNGLFSMARSGDSVSGVISSLDAAYQYRGTVGGSFYVAEIDRSLLPSCGGGPVPDLTAGNVAGAGEQAPSGFDSDEIPQGDVPQGAEDEVNTIDVLFVYTDDVARFFGGATGAEADILSTVGLSNQRFRTSDAGIRLRITSMREVEYDENGSADEDLDAITFEDGVIDEVHAWRNVDGADLVAMSVANMRIYAGLAWLGGSPGDSEFAVFSVTLHGSLDWAFTHEIGHNLGCAHDRENAGGGGYRNYSYGYRYEGAGGNTFRTQMAYDPGVRLERFSNPDLQFDGRPTGSGIADNARSIRESSVNVAAFRERIVVSGEGPVIDQISVTENPTVSANIFDGEIQSGEDVRISFDVVNPFDTDLTNLRLNVSATDEFIEVLDSTSDIPDMGAGASESVSEAIRLRIAGDAPGNFESSLITAFTSDQGTWTTTASVFIAPRPIDLQIESFWIDDSQRSGRIGNGNGIAEPGEEFDFRINVINRGTSLMSGSSGGIRFSDDCIRFKREATDLTLQSIAAGATRSSATFRVIADDCPRGTRVTVSADVESSVSGRYDFEKVIVLGSLELGAADTPITIMGDTPVRSGERLQLSPRVKNTGDAIATEVVGVIVALDSGLGSESDLPLEFGTINPGAEVGPSRAKSMRVTRFAPVGSQVNFAVEYESEGEVWVIPYALDVEPPITPPMAPEIDRQAGEGRLGVTVPQTHGGMGYQLEWSADMTSWESLGDVEVGTGDALSMDTEVPESAGGAEKIFLRVMRTMPDSA